MEEEDGLAATAAYDEPGAPAGAGSGAVKGVAETVPAGVTETTVATGVAAGALIDVPVRGGKASRRFGVGLATRCCTPGRADGCFLSASMYLIQLR